MSRPWTLAEERRIRRDYPAGDPCELARALGRTVAAVRIRACHLGIRREASSRWWTSGEEAELLRLVELGVSKRRIAQLLGRSTVAVRTRRRVIDRRRDE